MFSCSKKNSNSNATPVLPSSQNSFYVGEVKPAATKSCFAGAYYRKLVSSVDTWGGIGGRVVLPTIVFDPARINTAKPAQFLDNPSVYMGGNMGNQETDIGLTWEVIRDENGAVTADRRAFRPFLRRTAHAGSGQAALYENAPADARYYWYPGEEVLMSVKIIANGVLRLTIEGAGKKFEKDFEAGGYTFTGKGEFKRVNAIDQVANEGKPVQPTKTKVNGADWKSSFLYRVVNGTLVETPFHDGRYTDMRCPSTNYFSIFSTVEDRAKGGEKIEIYGAGY
ncbi:hypothetical protein [Pedobacter sp. SL55]|uniref:hypothetical protein n=1 Tax=Pedobacter sp. SL55 TaxID=2995161 RepID=UPI0022715CE4|nr:hypothetical protein [Pedobacter sp. SL55]WAC39498.1 hypothetical protein OVA16_12975 [Pedobacter sp. SL55]